MLWIRRLTYERRQQVIQYLRTTSVTAKKNGDNDEVMLWYAGCSSYQTFYKHLAILLLGLLLAQSLVKLADFRPLSAYLLRTLGNVIQMDM
jgi:hypothetical protein